MNRTFIVDGRRSYRIVALLVVCIGTAMFASGTIMIREGERKLAELRPMEKIFNWGVKRVTVGAVFPKERALIRKNIAELRQIVGIGGILRTYAWFVFLPGVLFLVEPILLFRILKLLRIDEERTA